ncbi:PadR family transcriptional regulator [Streptomyces sp. ODS28]|uniref:PadR family transcriptional regulator n=1 Tax=Streptomyces sp. ODS28 TaxID=3136688 RepID=UPI0031E779A3
MALRHAVLTALLDDECSGYELAKTFDSGMANFWHATPQQLYLELSKLEAADLVRGREVVQESRPNKRLFTVTEAGMAELERFAAQPMRASFIRDDLLVKVHAVDHIGAEKVIGQLRARAELADAKLELYEKILAHLRGGEDEESYLRTAARVGPYLTCLRGRAYESDTRAWCLSTAELLESRA